MEIGTKITDERAYKSGPIHKQIKLEVIVMLDAVPGAWHEPIDIMRWIASHNYVQSVEFLGKHVEENKP